MVFDGYFESGRKYFQTCATINAREKYYLPNMFNDQKCNYIKYGQNSIGSILTSDNRHYSESMLHQLEKRDKYNRKFVYYVVGNDNALRNSVLERSATRRDYVIHFNLEKHVTAEDILQSYYLGRLIDHYLQEAKKNSEDKTLTAHLTIQAIRRAEWEFV